MAFENWYHENYKIFACGTTLWVQNFKICRLRRVNFKYIFLLFEVKTPKFSATSGAIFKYISYFLRPKALFRYISYFLRWGENSKIFARGAVFK